MDVLPSLKAILSSLLFCGVGMVMFVIAFWGIQKLAPFSIRKELEDDQNTAVGIVIGAVMLGLAIIIAAAIH